MAKTTKSRRKLSLVDDAELRRAKRALGVRTDTEAVRLAIEKVTEMEEFWEVMKESRKA